MMRAASRLAAITAAALLATVAVAQESPEQKAVEARQGLMKLIVWEAGPLFAMAKGDIAYDAEIASAKAANLDALSRYAGHSLFLPGSSTEELGDATRALPAIWQDEEKFHQGFEAFREQVGAVVAEAGNGQAELRAAVAKLGRTCGDCHEAFRLKN